MDLIEYQNKTLETAVYPGAGTGSQRALEYTVIGMAGEAGESLECIKKLIRGDFGPDNRILPPHHNPEFLAKLRKEMGDVLWYFMRVLAEANWTVEEIAADNFAKLADRAERGVIHGSGNDR